MTKVLFLLVFCIPFGALQAAVFGDGRVENGVEDSRIPIVHSQSLEISYLPGTVVCAGNIRGTALLLSVEDENQLARPFVLTAAHVLPENFDGAFGGCGFRSGDNPWDSISLDGQSISGDYSGAANLEGFASDWVVVEVDPWINWERGAIPFVISLEAEESTQNPLAQPAIFAGYDTASSQILVDEECIYGYQSVSSDYDFEPALVWDNCDSESGSSGGALFAHTGNGPKLIAIRVGNLFDTNLYPDGPQQGDRFDLESNINVSRLINQDIRSAILKLLSN